MEKCYVNFVYTPHISIKEIKCISYLKKKADQGGVVNIPLTFYLSVFYNISFCTEESNCSDYSFIPMTIKFGVQKTKL